MPHKQALFNKCHKNAVFMNMVFHIFCTFERIRVIFFRMWEWLSCFFYAIKVGWIVFAHAKRGEFLQTMRGDWSFQHWGDWLFYTLDGGQYVLTVQIGWFCFQTMRFFLCFLHIKICLHVQGQYFCMCKVEWIFFLHNEEWHHIYPGVAWSWFLSGLACHI